MTKARRRARLQMLSRIVFATLVVLSLWPVPVLFSVSAKTEWITMMIRRETSWRVHGAHIPGFDSTREGFDGFIQPRPGVVVTMRRMERGPLHIHFQRPAADSTDGSDDVLAILRNENDVPVGKITASSATVELEPLAPNQVLTFSVVGDMHLGRAPDSGTYEPVPMVHSGVVAMSVPAQFGLGDDRLLLGRRELSAGDEFWIENAMNQEGFIRIDEGPHLTAIFRADGKSGRIARSGREYEFGSSAWDRIASDPFLQGAWGFWAFVQTFGAWPVPVAAAALATVVLGGFVDPAAAETPAVYVKTKDHGIGMPRWWEDGCYVITPAHVIADAAGDISLIGLRRRPAIGKARWSNPGLDLAVVQVTTGADHACPNRQWVPTGPLSDLFARETHGMLCSIGEDGGERRTPVVISKVQSGYVDVTPTSTGGAIVEGQSGSILEVGGRRAGMLLKVSEGTGRVMRQDYLEAILDVAVFAKRGWPEPGRTICLHPDAVTKPLVASFTAAITASGAKPRSDCTKRAGDEAIWLQGEETVDVLGDDTIVSVDMTVVVKDPRGEEKGSSEIRVTGSSRLDERRARTGLAKDLAEQIEKEGLATMVGMKRPEAARTGGLPRE